jgi:hypothetical protein
VARTDRLRMAKAIFGAFPLNKKSRDPKGQRPKNISFKEVIDGQNLPVDSGTLREH